MTAKTAMQIVTANHLLGGHSVFLCAEGWTADCGRARLAMGAGEAAALESLARADEAANRVVGVYLVAVELDAGGKPEPVHFREKLRARARPSFWSDAPAVRAGSHQAVRAEAQHVSL